MCWMTIRRDDSPLASGIDACKEHEQSSGGHSWGYAISDGEKLEIFKQVGTIDKFLMSPEAEVALVHTRLATRGEITEQNAHPFLIRWNESDGSASGDTEGGTSRTAALAHNGTWYGAPRDDRADSYHMARELEGYLREGTPLRESVAKLGSLTGETFIVLTHDARALVHSGRFSITREDNVVQSSGFHDIPTSDIVEL